MGWGERFGIFFCFEMFNLIVGGVRDWGESVGIAGDKIGCVILGGGVLGGGMVEMKLILVWSDITNCGLISKRSGVCGIAM